MNIIALFISFNYWQMEANKFILMRENGQTGLKEQQEICDKAWKQFKMQCQAFDEALKILLTAK